MQVILHYFYKQNITKKPSIFEPRILIPTQYTRHSKFTITSAKCWDFSQIYLNWIRFRKVLIYLRSFDAGSVFKINNQLSQFELIPCEGMWSGINVYYARIRAYNSDRNFYLITVIALGIFYNTACIFLMHLVIFFKRVSLFYILLL